MKTQDLAYILHRRPYQETSLLVDFFTQHHGVITAVCRGGRGSKKLALECFHPFWIEYRHPPNHTLATLYQWESDKLGLIRLEGRRLFCGLYLNELLIKLLGRHDPYTDLFTAYQETLKKLSQDDHFEKTLRTFEFFLLKETGYEISLEKDMENHQPIIEEKLYYYRSGLGFTMVNDTFFLSQESFIFQGKSLKAIAQNNFTESQTLQAAKRLIRLTLAALLEKKGPLKSRALFVHQKS